MPLASDIILDWIHDDGYSLSEAGWIRPQDHSGTPPAENRRPIGRPESGPTTRELARFLRDYVIENGSARGMFKSAAEHFRCGRASIVRQARMIDGVLLDGIE